MIKREITTAEIRQTIGCIDIATELYIKSWEALQEGIPTCGDAIRLCDADYAGQFYHHTLERAKLEFLRMKGKDTK